MIYLIKEIISFWDEGSHLKQLLSSSQPNDIQHYANLRTEFKRENLGFYANVIGCPTSVELKKKGERIIYLEIQDQVASMKFHL